ncbi:MAG: hypothetical protein HYR60_32490, partial [Acidobacteria bacterium]|nr:hypothetical protein [Acidobacteriota bacterium]
DLVEQTTAVIRKHRPDAVLSIDPGAETVRWHKTDHRMAAMNTIDAIRAAEWHLYFPNQRLAGLEPWNVPMEVFYYVTNRDANHWVNIDSVVEKKLDAAAAHVSQFPPSLSKYRPDWDPAALRKLKDSLRARMPKKDGHVVEAFRVARGFNQQ